MLNMLVFWIHSLLHQFSGQVWCHALAHSLCMDYACLLEFLKECSIPLFAEGVQHCDRVSSLQAFCEHDSDRRDSYASSNEQDACWSKDYISISALERRGKVSRVLKHEIFSNVQSKLRRAAL